MKDWLIDNLDWNDLNAKAREGVEGIHCTYFFELYTKKGLMSDYDEYCWRVKQAHFSKDDLCYICFDFSSIGFRVEAHCYGNALIEFVIKDFNGKKFKEEHIIRFSTFGLLRIENNRLVESNFSFFEEEICLCFD